MWLYIGLVLLGVLAGVLSGLAGVGGGIIVVPALVLLFGFGQHMAQGTSLAVLIPPVGLLAMIQYYRRGEVDLRAAILIAAGLVIGAILGAKVALGLPQVTLKRLFGVILLITSLRYLLVR